MADRRPWHRPPLCYLPASLLIVTGAYSALYGALEKGVTNGKAAIFAVRCRVYSVLPREQRPTSSPLALAALSLSFLIALALLLFCLASP